MTTGNFLVAVLAINAFGSITASSITDNGTGSAWQADVTRSASSTIVGLYVHSTIIGSSPPTTITWTLSTGAAVAIKVAEFSGVSASSWLDTAGTVKAQATGTAASTNTLTSTLSGDLIIGGFAVNSAQSGFTAGAGYTTWGTPTNTASPDVCAEYKLSGTTSETDGGTYGASVSTASQGVLVSYKAAGAAAGVLNLVMPPYIPA